VAQNRQIMRMAMCIGKIDTHTFDATESDRTLPGMPLSQDSLLKFLWKVMGRWLILRANCHLQAQGTQAR
jgi:hypothetical protein